MIKQYDIMKTKTPKQIHEQKERIFKNVGERYGRTERGLHVLLTIRGIVLRYWDNIYKSNGIADHCKSDDTEKCNYIWHNAATPREIYAK